MPAGTRRFRAGCTSRMVLWSNVLHLIAQKPWTGWGWGELDYAHYKTLYGGARFCDILDNAHNLPLHLAVELGLPLACALMFGGLYLVLRLAPWPEAGPGRQLAWGVLLMVRVHSMVEYPLWYGPFQMAVVLAALMLRRDPRPPRLAVPLLALAVVLCMAYAMWDYRRISQLYLAPAERAAAYREATLEKALESVVFQRQVAFAMLGITVLTQANARAMNELALDMLHFSPEPKVIETVIDMRIGRRLRARLPYRRAGPVKYPVCGGFASLLGGPRRTPEADQGPGSPICPVRSPKLVIDCARSGKDRVKDFVIAFTSSPSTADERPVIPFLNLAGYPHRSSGAATGSCLARGTSSRVAPPRGRLEGSALRAGTVAVQPPGAL